MGFIVAARFWTATTTELPAPVRIAVDVMGGDRGLQAVLPAVTAVLEGDADVHLCLVGPESQLQHAMQKQRNVDPARWQVEHAPGVVTMEDRPAHALRHKTDSSMFRALQLLASGQVHAVVSAGNTGALMVMGRMLCGTLAGIDRPAICSPLPARAHACYLLDLGANVDCRAEQLHQFAAMGSALASGMEGLSAPRVALLNIGRESWKGSEHVQRAAQLIKADVRLNYIGFVEGDALFTTLAEVVVCDGEVGNIALKACEGTAALIAGRLRNVLGQAWSTRLLAALARRRLQPLYRELDPEAHNGAVLLGLKGIVIKSHGNSTASGFKVALERAAAAVRNDVIGLLQQRLPTVGTP